MFLWCDGVVNDYGAYVGLGPQILLKSTAVGVTLNLPSGGSVPTAATTAGGGPIRGVNADVPWDVPFFNSWRSLIISNDAVNNVRRFFVDGWEITGAQTTASTVSVPANTAVTICPGATVRLSELIVWNDTVFSSTQVTQLKDAQRTKWNVVDPPVSGVTIGSVADPISVFKATLALTVTAPLNLPATVPTPTGCWLDASYVDSIRSDESGVTAAVPNGRVRLWMDRSGCGRHCTFPLASQAVWTTKPVDLSSTGLPLVVIGAGPGTFAATPLAAAFTVVAVWRLNAATGVIGGHPCGIGSAAKFGSTLWKETLGVDAARNMPLPTDPTGDMRYVTGDMVLALWERTADGTVTWRLRSLLGSGNSGAVQWSTTSAAADVDWLTETVQVNASGCYLALCELLVWRSALTPSSQAALQSYLQAKWGLILGTSAVLSRPFPLPANQLTTVPEVLLIDPSNQNTIKDANNNPVSVDGTFVRRIYAQPILRTVARWGDPPQAHN